MHNKFSLQGQQISQATAEGYLYEAAYPDFTHETVKSLLTNEGSYFLDALMRLYNLPIRVNSHHIIEVKA